MQNELIKKYFPTLTDDQLQKFDQFRELIIDYNSKINLISRKDTENFFERHILHSLAITKIAPIPPGSEVLDLGTGGGFPGIPMAIFYPDSNFTLIDSVQKKIRAVKDMIEQLTLPNCRSISGRAEEQEGNYNYVICRAVAPMETIVDWTKHLLNQDYQDAAWLCLKGGDLSEELQNFPDAKQFALKDLFDEEFFETKKMVHLQRKSL